MRGVLGAVLLSLASLTLSGCMATGAVVEQAESRELRYERFVSVTAAYETEHGLMLTLAARSDGERQSHETQLLITDSQLLRPAASWSDTYGRVGDRHSVYFLPRESRVSASLEELSTDGKSVTVEHLEISSPSVFDGPFALGEDERYRVYEIRTRGLDYQERRRTLPRSRPIERPEDWVAIVVASSAAQEAGVEPPAIQGTYDLGRARNELLALTPVTAAVDLATFPIQFVYTMCFVLDDV